MKVFIFIKTKTKIKKMTLYNIIQENLYKINWKYLSENPKPLLFGKKGVKTYKILFI